MNAIENNSVSLIKADNYTVNFGHRISTPPPTPITGTSSISPLTGAAASHLDDFPEETIIQLKKRITEIVSEKFNPEEHVKSRETQLFRF